MLVLVVTTAACGASTNKNLIFEKKVTVPGGRFVGPIEIEVPRREDHKNRDFEIHTELRAACGPLLIVSFPDGELAAVGSRDARWQELLAKRAENELAPAEVEPTPEPPAEAAPPDPNQAAPNEAPPYQPGRFVAVQTETWPGQLEFLNLRERRCTRRKTYRREYYTGYDESGRMTFWAETPQEIADAEITIKIYEVIDAEAEAAAEAAARKALQPPKVEVAVKAEVKAKPPKPIPPKPKPKKENPAPPKVEGARWVPGSWEYVPGKGRWVWYSGYWDAPSTIPAGKAEDTSNPPVEGARWQKGYWVWVQDTGEWRWTPGRWLAPPPKVEDPGQPEVPEQDWVPGYWVEIEVGKKFEWKPGHWGPPRDRAETPPPPPYKGAKWISGSWMRVKGKWQWHPGFYERSDRPPPPPKAETPGTPPGTGAVWLRGFWKWNDKRGDYEWVVGHWELPPGEGYVWVADPPPVQGGVSTSGKWVIDVNLDVKVKVEVKP